MIFLVFAIQVRMILKKGNAYAAAVHLRTINQFLKLVYLRK